MLSSHCPNELPVFCYNNDLLEETQTVLQKRRKRRISEHPPSDMATFQELVCLHRYVCFFVIQGSRSYYSAHSLSLRKRLATDYHDSMTTFIVSLNEREEETENTFYQGTGFSSFPSSSVLMTILNVTKVPTIVIVDTATGFPVSPDAGLAMEWNDAHYVLNAWQRKSSGLSWVQKLLAVVSCQSDCVIL